MVAGIGLAQGEPKDTEARVIDGPKPMMPAIAKERGVYGRVSLLMGVDKTGKAKSLEYYGPDNVCMQIRDEAVNALQMEAIVASQNATYQPAIRKGKPVKSTIWVYYDFVAPKPDDSAATLPLSSLNPKPKIISGGVLNGKAKSLPVPVYPQDAHDEDAAGAVAIQVLINEEGQVYSAHPVSGHPLLGRSARLAACNARFSPTLLQGNPVKVSGVITYNFVP